MHASHGNKTKFDTEFDKNKNDDEKFEKHLMADRFL